MIKKKLSIIKFRAYIPRIRCRHTLSEISDAKLKELCVVEKTKLEKPRDIKFLANCNLVWYSNKNGRMVNWNTANAKNLLVEEEVKLYTKNFQKYSVKPLIDKLKSGLKKDIDIIIVNDMVSNKKMIIEGVHRAIALYYLYLNEKSALQHIMESKHSINIIEITSPAGSLFFPYDYINIYKNKT